jgi:hypothetical protein
MSSIANKMQVQKMRQAYVKAWENILMVDPGLELTQKSALDEDYMRRLFAHIEIKGMQEFDLDSPHARITAAQLGILNTPGGWENFLAGKRSNSLL